MKKEHKVKFGKTVVFAKDITLPSPFKNIPKGEPFELVDAYKEDNYLFIGIRQTSQFGTGIAEAGFGISKKNPINSRMDMKKRISRMFIDHKDGFTYEFFEDGTYFKMITVKAGTITKL